MNRNEIIRLLVLNEISDDFEEPHHILDRISERTGRGVLMVSSREIQDALGDLVQLGLARVYELSPFAPTREVPGAVPRSGIASYYFFITEEGRRALTDWKGRWWPFDDEGEYLNGEKKNTTS